MPDHRHHHRPHRRPTQGHAAGLGGARDADASAPLPITGQPTAELLANGELLVYPGAPHGLYVTEKDRLNTDVLNFLDNTRNASALNRQPLPGQPARY